MARPQQARVVMYPRIVCAFAIMLAVACAWPSGVWAQERQCWKESERHTITRAQCEARVMANMVGDAVRAAERAEAAADLYFASIAEGDTSTAEAALEEVENADSSLSWSGRGEAHEIKRSAWIRQPEPMTAAEDERIIADHERYFAAWDRIDAARGRVREAEREAAGNEGEDLQPGFLARILRGAVNAYREADRALADIEMEAERTQRQQELRSACMDRAQTEATMRHCRAMPPH